MDTTTILALISCAVVFCGWLVLPHSTVVTARTVVKREPAAVPVSA
jgi:hypothetical protein